MTMGECNSGRVQLVVSSAYAALRCPRHLTVCVCCYCHARGAEASAGSGEAICTISFLECACRRGSGVVAKETVLIGQF